MVGGGAGEHPSWRGIRGGIFCAPATDDSDVDGAVTDFQAEQLWYGVKSEAQFLYQDMANAGGCQEMIAGCGTPQFGGG